MQITEKLRHEILFAMRELPDKEAEQIALINGVSKMTVYRYWKRLKTEDVEVNNIVLAIASLAASRKPAALKKQKKLNKIMKQLSAA
jgi:DNA-binding CsgD family transcriptional regulator